VVLRTLKTLKYNTMKNEKVDAVEYCEEKYPHTTKEFRWMLKHMYVTFCEKQYDYGPQNISLGRDLQDLENKRKSLQGLWFRSNDKLSRIDNLLSNMEANPKNESLEDSYLDLANYSVIAHIVNKNKWAK
jgi:hypothetical protein